MRALGIAGNYRGLVVADEPRAALVARDVLATGGDAADAAVAAYFTLAVTYPSAASLGAGGACLVYDAEKDRTEALDFHPVAASGGAVAVPGAARALFALQARYGRLEWSRLLAPGEQLARLGHPVSRALARALAAAPASLFADAATARLFARPDGTPLAEGDRLLQLDLAAVLTRLRTLGPGRLYGGDLGRELAGAAADIGLPLTLDDLRGYQPAWRKTAWVRTAFLRLHAVPSPAGQAALRTWIALDDAGYGRADPEERAGLVLAAAKDVAVGDPAGLAGPGAGFAAVDADGSAVACSVTLGRPFGIGRVVPGSGIFLAAVGGTPAASPAMLIDHNNHALITAATSASGSAAPVALAQVLADLRLAKRPLEAALAEPRLVPGRSPVRAYAEATVPDSQLAPLGGQGVVTVPAIDKIDAIHCPEGFAPRAGSCTAASDPRSYGMAAAATTEER